MELPFAAHSPISLCIPAGCTIVERAGAGGFRNYAHLFQRNSSLSATSLDLNRSTLTCHSRCMANGQVVLITTEQLGERPVTRTVYYVAEEDPVKTKAIIGRGRRTMAVLRITPQKPIIFTRFNRAPQTPPTLIPVLRDILLTST